MRTARVVIGSIVVLSISIVNHCCALGVELARIMGELDMKWISRCPENQP